MVEDNVNGDRRYTRQLGIQCGAQLQAPLDDCPCKWSISRCMRDAFVYSWVEPVKTGAFCEVTQEIAEHQPLVVAGKK
jgi:hypothetical protein